MTLAQLATALRERFARLRGGFPDVVAKMWTMSDEQVLQGNLRCGACGKKHVTTPEAMALVESCSDISEWLSRMQALCERRFPRACLRKLSNFERAISRAGSN